MIQDLAVVRLSEPLLELVRRSQRGIKFGNYVGRLGRQIYRAEVLQIREEHPCKAVPDAVQLERVEATRLRELLDRCLELRSCRREERGRFIKGGSREISPNPAWAALPDLAI